MLSYNEWRKQHEIVFSLKLEEDLKRLHNIDIKTEIENALAKEYLKYVKNLENK